MNSDDVEIRAERMAAAEKTDSAQGGGVQAVDDRAGRAYRGQQPPASMFGVLQLRWIALMTGAAAFGASALSLAILGLGVPFLVADLLAALWAGLLIYALGRWALARAAAKDADRP